MDRERPRVARVGVLGDVHGEDQRLERALEFFEGQRLDRVLAVGDLVDGPGDVARALALLEERGVDAVRGNHDRWFLAGTERHLPYATRELPPRAVSYLRALPATRAFETPRGGLLLGHGVGEDDMSFLNPETAGYRLQEIAALHALQRAPSIQYFIGGHTHRRMVRAFAGLTVVNAGTIFREDEAFVVIVDFSVEKVSFYGVSDDAPPRFKESFDLPRPQPYRDPSDDDE